MYVASLDFQTLYSSRLIDSFVRRTSALSGRCEHRELRTAEAACSTNSTAWRVRWRDPHVVPWAVLNGDEVLFS